MRGGIAHCTQTTSDRARTARAVARKARHTHPQPCDVRCVYLDFLRVGSCAEAAHPMCVMPVKLPDDEDVYIR